MHFSALWSLVFTLIVESKSVSGRFFSAEDLEEVTISETTEEEAFYYDATEARFCGNVSTIAGNGTVKNIELYESVDTFHPNIVILFPYPTYVYDVNVSFLQQCLWVENYRDCLDEGLEVFTISQFNQKPFVELKEYYEDRKHQGSKKSLVLSERESCDQTYRIRTQYKTQGSFVIPKSCSYWTKRYKFGLHISKITFTIGAKGHKNTYSIMGKSLCNETMDLTDYFAQTLGDNGHFESNNIKKYREKRRVPVLALSVIQIFLAYKSI